MANIDYNSSAAEIMTEMEHLQKRIAISLDSIRVLTNKETRNIHALQAMRVSRDLANAATILEYVMIHSDKVA